MYYKYVIVCEKKYCFETKDYFPCLLLFKTSLWRHLHHRPHLIHDHLLVLGNIEGQRGTLLKVVKFQQYQGGDGIAYLLWWCQLLTVKTSESWSRASILDRLTWQPWFSINIISISSSLHQHYPSLTLLHPHHHHHHLYFYTAAKEAFPHERSPTHCGKGLKVNNLKLNHCHPISPSSSPPGNFWKTEKLIVSLVT